MRQVIAKHLRVLDGGGLARARRRGREQVWALDAKPLADARASPELISRHWEQALRQYKELFVRCTRLGKSVKQSTACGFLDNGIC